VVKQSTELYGRGKIIRFVADALNRADGRDNPTPPMMILMGVCGSGKTVLVERLEAIHRPSSPTARLDFAGHPDATPAEVMVAIGGELHARVARVGKVEFPLLGMGVMALTLDPDSPLAADDQLKQRLDSGASGKALADLTAQAAKLLPTPQQQALIGGAGAVLGWIVDKVKGSRRDARLAWYSQNFRPGVGRGPLIELYHRWHASEDKQDAEDDKQVEARREGRRDVWRALCMAFLADLRAFSGTSWWNEKTTNCLLLLDNADTAIGVEFLEMLAECREKAEGKADPLLVVAAQRTRPKLRPPVGRPVDATDERLVYAEWLETTRDPEAPPAPWYPVRLTELSAENVKKIVTTHVLGLPWHDQQFVREVTGGHSAAAWELANVLEHAKPGSRSRDLITREVEDALLGLLRPDGDSEAELTRMAVFAATLRPKQEPADKVFEALRWERVKAEAVKARFLDLMWASDEDGFVIHRLPRLLLTRWLARDADLWKQVHEDFQTYYRGNEAKEPAPVWYHELALMTALSDDNLEKAADYLNSRLVDESGSEATEGKLSPNEWDPLLIDVATAPSRLQQAVAERSVPPGTQGLHAAAEDVVSQLAGLSQAGDRPRVIKRLVAALWLYNDRLFDAKHTLAGVICEEFSQLAPLTPGDCQVFYDRASSFCATADEWKDRLWRGCSVRWRRVGGTRSSRGRQSGRGGRRF
jgi:hypothetical protein